MFQIRDALTRLCGAEASRAERLSVLKDAGLALNTGPMHYLSLLKRRLQFGPRLSALEAIRRVLRGRNSTYQADSYTHVQEETYLWGELIDVLERTGWCFMGWPKKSGMPDRPEDVLRGQALEKAHALSLREQAAVYECLVKPDSLFFLAVPG